MDFPHAAQDLLNHRLVVALLLDGCVFHMQSITAYALMSYISPVTHR